MIFNFMSFFFNHLDYNYNDFTSFSVKKKFWLTVVSEIDDPRSKFDEKSESKLLFHQQRSKIPYSAR